MPEPLTEAYEAPRQADLSVAERPGACVISSASDDMVWPATGGTRAMTAARPQHGRFTILKAHAQGGLGRVSIARDEKLRRHVALKEIRPDRLDNAALRQRFLTEAEITGQLEHPGIVPIYALDEDANGQPYYAMRFVAGRTLAEAIAAYHGQPTTLAFRDLLKRFSDVCQTIAYAHSKGVIHRDLKPANVLLGEYGETLVLDWGLAKQLLVDASSEPRALVDAEDRPFTVGASPETPVEGLTEAGQVLGTPAFMSPEQAEGQSARVGPATDIYALGAILYQVLSGRVPYRGKNAANVLAQVRIAPPPAPSEVRRGLPRPLEAVCLKAMARHAADRYLTATELAREIEHWLADEPVSAYSEPVLARLGRWARRHKPAVAGGIALLTSGVIALVVSTWFISIEKARADAREAERHMHVTQHLVSHNHVDQLGKENRRLRETRDSAHDVLSWATTQIGQSQELNQPDLQALRKDLLQKALTHWDRAVELAQVIDRDSFRLQRAICLARAGEHARAVDEAKDLPRDKESGEQLHCFARVYALAAMAVKDDPQRSTHYADRAMENLLQARAAGFFKDREAVEKLRHPDLDPLRSRDDFVKLLQEVQAK
jgi:serine/threonine-protein kinase